MMQNRRCLSTRITTIMFFFGLFLIVLAVYLKATEVPSPSYPDDEWEFLWFKYTEDPEDPWGEYIKKTQCSDWNFDYNYTGGIVADTGEFELVGFRASRTLFVSSRTRYGFLLGSDDGCRLYIYDSNFEDVTRMAYGWRDQSYSVYSCERVLDEGEYKILLEWYEHFDLAQITFNMTIIK